MPDPHAVGSERPPSQEEREAMTDQCVICEVSAREDGQMCASCRRNHHRIVARMGESDGRSLEDYAAILDEHGVRVRLSDGGAGEGAGAAAFNRGDRVKGRPGVGTVVEPTNAAGHVGVYWDSRRLNTVEWPQASLLASAARAGGPPTPDEVERAAEAIAKQAEPMYGPGWEALSPARKGACRDQARAALDAARREAKR